MKKKMLMLALCFACISAYACSAESTNTSTPKNESSTVTTAEQTSKPTEAAQTTQTETAKAEKTEASKTDKTEAAQPITTEAASAEQTENKSVAITENQALDAVKNYCFAKNPTLKDTVDSSEHTVYWDVTTNENNEIVVLFRSYTGAQMRYYVDPASGATYVTELVPGIIDEEQRTEESLNIKDYLA